MVRHIITLTIITIPEVRIITMMPAVRITVVLLAEDITVADSTEAVVGITDFEFSIYERLKKDCHSSIVNRKS